MTPAPLRAEADGCRRRRRRSSFAGDAHRGSPSSVKVVENGRRPGDRRCRPAPGQDRRARRRGAGACRRPRPCRRRRGDARVRADSADGSGSRRAPRRCDLADRADARPRALAHRVGAGTPTAATRCYGCTGRAVERVRAADLDDPPEVHDRDTVADVTHHAEVVRDEQVGTPRARLDLGEQVQDLRLHRETSSAETGSSSTTSAGSRARFARARCRRAGVPAENSCG